MNPTRLLKAKLLLCLFINLAAPAAQAATASASLSNVRVQLVDLTPDDGNFPWVWVVNNVDWVARTSSVSAQIPDAAVGQESLGWLGGTLSAQTLFGGTQAHAAISSAGDLSDASGSASATAADGLSAWAISQIFSGRVMAGAGTRVVVTAQLDGISAWANGGLAQATASLGLANETGGAFDSSQAWAFDSPDFQQTDAPTMLSVHWDNASADAAWGQLWITLSAQAIAATAPVPEPASALLLGLGLAALAARRRH
jgi:PEP-CTERM motif